MVVRLNKYIQTIDIAINEKLEPCYNGSGEDEKLQYFYHPDHLGSSSFITDATGYATQHLQYLPFGETFVDQQNGYDSRYTFSAKEKDDETQYSYFGARYYDSDLSVWLSVDPMAAKYPSMSPYMYCAGNPVIYKDSDGRDIVIWYIDENSGLLQKFTFNGQNAANAPDNIFVQSFLSAYIYNIGNGGGEFMQYAANDHDNNYNVVDAKYSKYATKSTMFVPNYYKDEYEILFWDPNMGSLHSDNKITSPASDAEHEFRHYVDYIRLSLKKYYELRNTRLRLQKRIRGFSLYCTVKDSCSKYGSSSRLE